MVRCTLAWKRKGTITDLPADKVQQLAGIIASAPLQARRLLVATDGGSDGGPRHEETVATWAVAVHGHRVGGLVPGMDATPRAAEHFAANVALAAAAAAKRDVMMLIDNAGVCRKIIAAFRGQLLEQAENNAFWQHDIELCGQRQHAGAWVPSHGKRPDWRAPACYTADECRQGNDTADEECTGAKITGAKIRWMRT